MNLVLVGYRGTGKSSVARILGVTLGRLVVSLDDELERRARKSIPEVVQERGWPGFRDLEERLVADFAGQDRLVLDCGGGVIEREANIERLQQSGPVVWLTASPRVIVERIEGDHRRPSLTEGKSFTDEVREVLERRAPLYDRISDYRVDTEGRIPEEIASEILELTREELEETRA